SYWPPEIYEEYIAILTGKQPYSASRKEILQSAVTTWEDMRNLVERQVAPDLVLLLCMPQEMGFNPKQSMSRTALDTYLYAHSRWIEDYFTGANEVSGSRPEIKIGEWSRFFTKAEVEAFDIELSNIAYPTDPQVLEDGF